MKLYGFPISGNTHKVRLLLSALHLKYEEHTVDVTQGAHKAASFLAINPRGQIPVLEDGAMVVSDSQAILLYLARKYDRDGTWYPGSAEELGEIASWLSFASNELQNGVHMARLNALLDVPVPLEYVRESAIASLKLLNQRLADRKWLVGQRASLADLACFPCVALAPEAHIELASFPAIQAWISAIKALPFYVSMPGLTR
jgi:glutathione S-transferase